MGEIRTSLTLENVINAADIRTATVDALVDTGAVVVMLPEEIVDELALGDEGLALVRYADEREETRRLAGPVRVRIGSRSMSTECIVGPAGSEPLVGQLVLERLDLIADCTRRTLTPRRPNYPLLKLK